MTDRKIVSGNLPAEFAERVSDPIDLADRLAWERARRRYQRSSAMPEFKHVTISTGHFLVVNGTRGPLAYGSNEPAIHPAGYLYFPKDGTRTPPAMRGKLLQVTEIVVPTTTSENEEGVKAAYEAWQDTLRYATNRQLEEWPEAK